MEQKPRVLVPVTEKPLEIGVQDHRGKELLVTSPLLLHILPMLSDEQIRVVVHEQQTLLQHQQLVLVQHDLQSAAQERVAEGGGEFHHGRFIDLEPVQSVTVQEKQIVVGRVQNALRSECVPQVLSLFLVRHVI